MKIIYKLEIHYFGLDQNGNKIDRIDNFIFDKESSFNNRINVIHEFENYKDIFNDAVKFGKLKFSWEEIIDKKLVEYHIPRMNIYYTDREFNSDNEGIVLFGSLLENFEERIVELEDELKFYQEKNISFEQEILTDNNNNQYKIIKGSLLCDNDSQHIRNVC